jgi:hypothetical protein
MEFHERIRQCDVLVCTRAVLLQEYFSSFQSCDQRGLEINNPVHVERGIPARRTRKTQQMLSIQAACPSLFDLVLPAIEGVEEELEMHSIQRSATQIHISVAARLQASFCTNVLRLSITSMRMDLTMRTLLGRAYSEDYDMPNVVDPGRGSLQWFKKFSYTSTRMLHLHSYSVLR